MGCVDLNALWFVGVQTSALGSMRSTSTTLVHLQNPFRAITLLVLLQLLPIAFLFLLPCRLVAAPSDSPASPAAFDPVLGPPFPLRLRAQLGQPSAKVVVIEFSDFSCPHCRAFHASIFPELRKTYIDKGLVLWVVVNASNTPSDQTNPAFPIARCALNTGVYWRTAEELFRFGERPNATVDDLFKIYSPEEQKQIESCYLDHNATPEVARDFEEYTTLKIRGTPTLVLRKKYSDGSIVETRIEDLQPLKYYQRVVDHLLKEP